MELKVNMDEFLLWFSKEVEDENNALLLLNRQLEAAKQREEELVFALQGCIEDSRKVLYEMQNASNRYKTHQIEAQKIVIARAEQALANVEMK